MRTPGRWFCLLLALMPGSLAIRAAEPAPKPPNVILIVADDLGYGDLGCYGNPIIRTPHVDRLADQGVLLTQHYSASPKCAPARAALLTGRYNHRTGAVDVPSNRGLDRISLDETTLAEAMKAAGYATGMVGKWHNGAHDMRYHPNARGFDEFVGFLNGGMDYYRWVLDYNGKPKPSDGRYLTDVLTEESIGFIRRHRAEPFFLHVAYNAPHSPLQAPSQLIERYRQTGKLNRTVSTIYAMIEQMDTGVGRIVSLLDELELGENTVVIFTSDNGPHMGGNRRYNGPFSGQKGDSLEGGIRVPAVVRWPARLPKGVRLDRLVHFVDWFPTLLSLTGKPGSPDPPPDVRNILPLLLGNALEPAPQRLWYWQHNRYTPLSRCNAAIRDGKWKLYWPPIPGSMAKDPVDTPPYIEALTHAHRLMPVDTTLPRRKLPRAEPPRLFDLQADPAEKNDLAAQYPDRVLQMQRQWDAWFDRVMADYRRARAGNVATE